MKDHFVFGYGSLVNDATHSYGRAHLAELHGWRRQWRYTDLRAVAYLSVVPDPGSSIRGVILNVPRFEPELAQREAAYERKEVAASVHHGLDRAIDITLFAIPTGEGRKAGREHSILLSYVDVVVQGYARTYGEAGVRRFFETTELWGAPIVNDRADPVYPRHQALNAQEIALTDHWLDQLAAKVE